MSLFSIRIDTKHMVPVCRELATYYDAGVPITRALDSIASHAREPRVKRVFRAMQEDVTHGATLEEAVKNQQRYLSPFFVHLMSSGEKGGKLDVMLQDLARYFEDRLALIRSIRSRLAYPLFLLGAAWFVGTFAYMMIQNALAAATGRGGGGAASVMEAAGRYATFQTKALIVFACVILLAIVLARMGLLGWITGSVSTHVWPFAKVTRKFGIAQFFRSFGLLLSSGMSVTKSIENAAATTTNPYIERDFLTTVPLVKQGVTLSEAFSHCKYMTPTATEMLAVGEESGNLDSQLAKLAEYEHQEAVVMADRQIQLGIYAMFFGIVFLAAAMVIYFYLTLYGGLMDAFDI